MSLLVVYFIVKLHSGITCLLNFFSELRSELHQAPVDFFSLALLNGFLYFLFVGISCLVVADQSL